MKKWLAFFSGLLIIDALTKFLAIHFIPYFHGGLYPFGGIPVMKAGPITFSLNYIVNTGVAWGIFAGHAGLLFSLRTCVILALVLFVRKKVPVWLIITGAIGNVIDYCLYGHVIDFLHFTFWGYSFPIFNIADSCITLGVLSLLLLPSRAKEASAL